MWSIAKPTMSAEDAFVACCAHVGDPTARLQLAAIAPNVAALANHYEAYAAAGELYQFPRATGFAGVVSDEMMRSLYDRMVRKDTQGRAIYNRLLASAPNARCPHCGHHKVTTLDHYLPRQHFAGLAVIPHNLVPACADCNRIKHNRVATAKSEQMMHPYFDNVESDRWLYAAVVESRPTYLSFFVNQPNGWTVELGARVSKQFADLQLSGLYSSNAAEELANIRLALIELHQEGGSNLVRDHLEQQAKSRLANRQNSWQAATYSALATSDWFCGGNFA